MKASTIRFQLAGLVLVAVAFCACGGGNGAGSTERLAARRVVEAKADPAALLEPAARRGLEDAEEPETVAQLGVVAPEGSVAPGSAAVAAPASRAWADQGRVARERPVTEDLGAGGDSEAVERERAQGGRLAAVMVGQAVARAREGSAVASVVARNRRIAAAGLHGSDLRIESADRERAKPRAGHHPVRVPTRFERGPVYGLHLWRAAVRALRWTLLRIHGRDRAHVLPERLTNAVASNHFVRRRAGAAERVGHHALQASNRGRTWTLTSATDNVPIGESSGRNGRAVVAGADVLVGLRVVGRFEARWRARRGWPVRADAQLAGRRAGTTGRRRRNGRQIVVRRARLDGERRRRQPLCDRRQLPGPEDRHRHRRGDDTGRARPRRPKYRRDRHRRRRSTERTASPTTGRETCLSPTYRPSAR